MANETEGDFGFKVSPRVLAPLGLEQLPDPSLAVLELIKNSWDADASTVRVTVDQQSTEGTISVVDNGVGMTPSDFRDRWLVIGASHKRDRPPGRRPLIGEKGLGRLASYALGSNLTIESATQNTRGFEVKVNWDAFFASPSVEAYRVRLQPSSLSKGTVVTIGGLRSKWTERDTDFLTTYTQFLTSVPGEKFRVSLTVDGVRRVLADPLDAVESFAEAELEMRVLADGTPVVSRCSVGGVDYTWVQFRNFKPALRDPRLSGSTLSLKFYRRDNAQKKLSGVLSAREVNELLDKYQGVRIYRDGINVPPYGLAGNDWAALERQRTSTGGPTMVPGNTQLVGALSVPPLKHLSITAGRSGFADQDSVAGLAEYVRWAVRELGTARRAHDLGIEEGRVPSRVDTGGGKSELPAEKRARKALADISRSAAVRSDPDLRKEFELARSGIETVLDKNEQTLRLYAQLASTGIAATSFAHELRTDFDVVTAAVREIDRNALAPDQELKELLVGAWARIKNFVALFRLLPIKIRRSPAEMDKAALQSSVESVFRLVPADSFEVAAEVGDISVRMVPAELDSILLNLVSNAVKAISESPQARDGRILVQLEGRGGDFHVAVYDNGCGIPKALKGVIFEPLEGAFAEGTGMGLAIVRFIAERYKGGISAVVPLSSNYATCISVKLKGVVR